MKQARIDLHNNSYHFKLDSFSHKIYNLFSYLPTTWFITIMVLAHVVTGNNQNWAILPLPQLISGLLPTLSSDCLAHCCQCFYQSAPKQHYRGRVGEELGYTYLGCCFWLLESNPRISYFFPWRWLRRLYMHAARVMAPAPSTSIPSSCSSIRIPCLLCSSFTTSTLSLSKLFVYWRTISKEFWPICKFQRGSLISFSWFWLPMLESL